LRPLFFLVTAAVIYLSVFPGRFDWSRPMRLVPPFHPILYNSDIIDVIVNVPFYLPLGFTAVAAWTRRPGWRAILLATLFGTAISYGVEFVQQFVVPRRFSNSRDILFNAIGAALGAWLATQPRWRNLLRNRPLYAFGQSPAAWWMIACWWCWLMFPFYPNIRLVQLTRMLEHSREELAGFGLSLVVIGTHLAGGAVLASVAPKRRWVMPALATTALMLMAFIYGLRFSPSRVAATAAGFALAHLLDLHRHKGRLAALVCGWAGIYLFWYGASGLAPYDTTWEVAPDVARASWRTPVRDFAGKLFLASAAAWALWPRRR